ncbi:hypothetical protein FBY03_11619 [Pseudomonas sp. SJZ079]|nr:hypothetical protein FBY03_11619 [Pseudomonas sp. SJZ079]
MRTLSSPDAIRGAYRTPRNPLPECIPARALLQFIRVGASLLAIRCRDNSIASKLAPTKIVLLSGELP